MTIDEAIRSTIRQLNDLYDSGESESITNWVMEAVTGLQNPIAPYQKSKSLDPDQQFRLDNIVQRLLTYEPLQYILNEAWFCGLKFYVDKHVLIPRPETEELVEWIISNFRFPLEKCSILDLGTGSGCIPIALKRRLRKAEVWACDISDAALNVARKNAENLGTEIQLLQLDILNPVHHESLPPFDIIVSNPPYVPISAKKDMLPNVADYEPETALFVPDDNPLVFYKVIAELATKKLNRGGALYFEIHEPFANEIMVLLQEKGFDPELKKDMQGKDRMVRAVWK